MGKSFEILRQKFPYFVYENYTYRIEEDQIKVDFLFNLSDTYFFTPSLCIPRKDFYHDLTASQWDILLFHIGLIELISYWKAACSPKVVIKPFALDEKQILWFKKLYFHGLGEFFYLNHISITEKDFMEIVCESDKHLAKQTFQTQDTVIVPIGGGKDSVVTLEILQQNQEDVTPLIINPRGATLDCITAAGFNRNQIIEIRRTICPQLLKLNEQGFLNGHTPFSAMLAFVSLLSSALTQKRHIALSNEGSANESTVQDSTVNHQYSKSYEFESDFRNYVRQYITDDINYFSFLRPLSELQIASLFAKYPKYFPVFKSCNVGSKTDVWCGNCAKCLFAYIILSPFIDPEKMEQIFGKNLWEDEGMLLFFQQLTGTETCKPFECVGTIEEVNAALILTVDRFYKNISRPFLLKDIQINTEEVKMAESLLSHFESEHFLMPRFEKYLANN